jgi:hypothetical protein
VSGVPGGPPNPSAKGPRAVRGPLLGLATSMALTISLLAVLIWATC